MVAITHIGTYLPQNKINNLERTAEFGVDENFISEKIGVLNRRIKSQEQKASDLCVEAFQDLKSQKEITLDEIDCCVVVTQNPDYNLPHTSAIVHGLLDLPESCACFDISLGCSGYVYALAVLSAFMEVQGFRKGLLFTADAYSSILNESDKNTALIFGDGATVSLLESGKPGLSPICFDFGSKGKGYKNLINNGSLHMNGRMVFNFSATTVPKSIDNALEKAGLNKSNIEKWYLHQGSKYIVDTIAQRAELDPGRVVFGMYDYGNTVSSSIPMLLKEDLIKMKSGEKYCLSGFGVGLSWATGIFEYK